MAIHIFLSILWSPMSDQKNKLMTQEVKKGDVVSLKSGGPKMTVEGFQAVVRLDGPSHEDKSKVNVSWFDSGKLMRNTFDVEVLEILDNSIF